MENLELIHEYLINENDAIEKLSKLVFLALIKRLKEETME
jgi:hypothetical protein